MATTKRSFLAFIILIVGLSALWLFFCDRIGPQAGNGRTAPAPATSGVIVVDYIDGTPLDVIKGIEAKAGLNLAYTAEGVEEEALRSGQVPDEAAAIAALKDNPLVEAVEQTVEMHALGYPDDPLFAKQWNLTLLDTALAWRAGKGSGVVVAVIDTGVTPHHDLPESVVLAGRSFVPGSTSTRDDHGHGTHVAGTIAQATNNGFGAAGIAPRARILPLKVLDAGGSGRSDWIAAAIDEAVHRGAQVINLSLGGGHSEVIVRAVEKARHKGVVVVAAAGNSGAEGLGSPADALSALAVTAVGPDDRLAPYSSWGQGVEIAAPGGNTELADGGIIQGIVDHDGQERFVAWQGTSMASPHVAAAAAVLWGAGATSADEVEQIIKKSAVERGDALHFGAGRLTIGGAVQRLLIYKHGFQAALALLIMLAIFVMAPAKGYSKLLALLVAVIGSGGLFFLLLLPAPPSRTLALLAKPLLAWPGSEWSRFPLWASCLLPLALVMFLGPVRRLSALLIGLCVAFAAPLLYGAITGGIDLWWLPSILDRAWLGANGLFCLLAALAVAGLAHYQWKSEGRS